MKHLKLLSLLFFAGLVANAQLKTPQPSPGAKIEQTVGLTEVTITYSRPSMKGRTVFGNLVPYDKLWRTGANENTVITFSDDVIIGGSKVTKGSYAIYSKPGKESWEVYFYQDTNNWGNPKSFDESKIVAKATGKVEKVPFDVETFTIDFNNLTNNGASLEFMWENVYVAIPIETLTKEQTIAAINKTLKDPSASARDYYSAANYYYQEGINIKEAVKYVDKAIEMQKDAPYWMLRAQSLIHAEAGDKKGAIEAAKLSLQKAKEDKNDDYVKMNQDSLKEWTSK